jgi:hypothetical protein
LAAGIEPAAKRTHSPPPQAAGQPERFSRIKAEKAALFAAKNQAKMKRKAVA